MSGNARDLLRAGAIAGRRGAPLVLALLALLVTSSLATGSTLAGSAPPLLSGAPPAAHPLGPAAMGSAALDRARASLAAPGAPTALEAPSWVAAPRPGILAPGPTAVSLVYDAADGYVLALAPNITGNYSSTIANLSRPSQTWSFSNGIWTERHPSLAPSSRGFAAMTYDARDGYVVLFGGVPTYGYCLPYAVANHPGAPYYDCYADTWTYAGGIWTNVTATVQGSPPRYFYGTQGFQAGPQFVYDASDGYALLYGENNSETWGYSAGQWLNLTATSGTPPGVWGSMAYDAADGYVLYFGGEPTGWNGSAFGGSSQTWEFAHGHWTDVTYPFAIQPSPRSFASMTFDAAIGQVVLFGGVSRVSGAYQNYFDTWVYQGAGYGNASPGWYELSGRGGPSPRFGGALTYDPADRESVFFGGTYVSPTTTAITAYRETWALAHRVWTSAGPLIASSRTSLDRGTNLSLSVVGLPFDAFAGGQFVYHGLPPGCVASNLPNLSCAPQSTGSFRVSVNFTSALGSASASVTLTVNPEPLVQAIGLSRSVTEPGVPVTVNVSVAGGTGPFAYAYANLPGCAGPNASTFTCDPTAPGTYAISVVATDDVGLRSTFAANLLVVPDLSVGPVIVSPETTDVGRPTVVNVGLGGGLGPFRVAFQGLPPGCASANQTALTCDPAAAGNYLLSVSASDVAGLLASGTAVLHVNPAPTLTSFTASGPDVAAGSPMSFRAELAGGTVPFTFRYQGLPGGCAGANTSTLVCTPSRPGTFLVVVTATDAVGASVTKSVSVVVRSAGPGGSGFGGPFGATAFGQGLLVGLLVLAIVAVAAGWSAVASARATEAARLADELAERAPELAREVEAPDDAWDPEGAADVP